jgi:hypothetical protein
MGSSGKQNENIHTACLVLVRVENGKGLKWRLSAVDRVYTLRPSGSHRGHAVVLEGRIDVLGDGSGKTELSRIIFGRTSWLQVLRWPAA